MDFTGDFIMAFTANFNIDFYSKFHNIYATMDSIAVKYVMKLSNEIHNKIMLISVKFV